jgi:hypothetical protein
MGEARGKSCSPDPLPRQSCPDDWADRPEPTDPMLGLPPVIWPHHKVNHRRPGRRGQEEIIGGHQRDRAPVQVQAPKFRGDERREDDRPDPGEREDASEDVGHLTPRREFSLSDGERAPDRQERKDRPEEPAGNGAAVTVVAATAR